MVVDFEDQIVEYDQFACVAGRFNTGQITGLKYIEIDKRQNSSIEQIQSLFENGYSKLQDKLTEFKHYVRYIFIHNQDNLTINTYMTQGHGDCHKITENYFETESD